MSSTSGGQGSLGLDDLRPPGDGDDVAEEPGQPRRPSRRAVIAGAVAVVAAAGGVGAGVALWPSGSPSSKPTSGASPGAAAPSPSDAAGVHGWLSGASGDGVADGSLAAWRGSELGIAATWADNNDAMVAVSQLDSGGEYADWKGPLDVAIGAIGSGESWRSAAKGAYADRWVKSLTTLHELWGDRQDTLYLRFAHEMNGNWYPWAVQASAGNDFTQAWKQFRAMQQDIFPQAKLVFCVNRESSKGQADWRSTFPGPDFVDVMGVDYYNQNPGISTQEAWEASMTGKDALGAPKGLEGHRLFAQDAGLPLALPEWSTVADTGDSPVFVEQMHAFFSAHAGTGAGKILYEALFNASDDSGKFQLFADSTKMPHSAARYRQLWTSRSN